MTAPAPQSQPEAAALRHTDTPWMWAWRDDETAPASIFSMPRVGHAYAVAMCPRYQKPEQWVADAKFIIEAVNSHATLQARVNEMEAESKMYFEQSSEFSHRAATAESRVEELTKALEEIVKRDQVRVFTGPLLTPAWVDGPSAKTARRALAPSLEGRGGAT